MNTSNLLHNLFLQSIKSLVYLLNLSDGQVTSFLQECFNLNLNSSEVLKYLFENIDLIDPKTGKQKLTYETLMNSIEIYRKIKHENIT